MLILYYLLSLQNCDFICFITKGEQYEKDTYEKKFLLSYDDSCPCLM